MKSLIYRIVKRILTWFGDVMLATTPPSTKAKQIIEMMSAIQSGDVICRKYNYYLDSYFIPGKYTHSGIVKSKDEIIHSVAEGVQFVHPIDFIKDTDGFVVLRPKYPHPELIRNVIEKALFHVNREAQYDFLFNDPDKLYCHELTCDCLYQGGVVVYASTFNVGVWPIKFKKTAFLADDIIKMCNVIYEF